MRGCGSSPRPASTGSRSRSATSSGSTRPSWSSAGCSPRAGSRRIYAIASRRAGPFPARIRDVGVTVDLATHDVDILSLDRRRAAVARLRRDRPADPRRPRGPPVRAAPLPVRGDRHARRQLADAGEAPPARRRRRGRHVRARLPDPAPDVHEGDRHDEPAPDRRLRADVRGRGRRAAGRVRRAARGGARRVPRRRPRRRPPGHRRRGRPVGRRGRHLTCSTPPRAARAIDLSGLSSRFALA